MPRPSVERERREQILRACCEVIAEVGFRALRVGDVACRANVSNGMVHYYFDSKDALLHAAFEYNFRDSLTRRKWILEQAGDPLDQLHRLVASYLPTGPETITAWRVWVELWASALNNQELQRLNDAVYDEWRAIMTATVEAGARDRLLDVGDPASVTDTLLGLLDGLAIQVLTGSTHITAERMLELCDTFIDSLTTSQAGDVATKR